MVDHRGLVEAVRSLDADVVGLQEVDRHVPRSWWRDQARLLAGRCGHRVLWAPARRLGGWGTYGNALLHRGEVVRHRVLPLRSTGEPRCALVARLELTGQRVGQRAEEESCDELTVAVTHLQNPSPRRPDEAVGQLVEVTEELARWPEPWLLLGDLNLGPELVEPILAGADLRPVPSGMTFPSSSPRQRIDWVAVRGLEVVSAHVPAVTASDHRPVVATLCDPG